MRKIVIPGIAAALGVATALAVSAPAAGRQTASLDFYSGGGGANAHWLATADQPSGDTDPQAIEIHTTTDPNGYAGIYVHHVEGTPTASFPNSSYWVKTTDPVAPGGVGSLGSPRLVITFSDGGNADLRPLVLTNDWQQVQDGDWDNTGGSCGGGYNMTWQQVQGCHAGTTITSVYFATDPYGFTYRLDDLNIGGNYFTFAGDNNNAPA